MMKLLFLLHLLVTLLMMGIIWFVQIVHYPLFARVGAADFQAYESLHRQWTGWVVAPLMLLELGTALALLWQAPAALPGWSLWAGAVMVGLLWGSTFFLSVPLHMRLDEGYDPEVVRRLVQTNWPRTVLWSLRGGLCLWWVMQIWR
jgi:hypothetical protein